MSARVEFRVDQVHPSAFIAHGAAVLGDVTIGEQSSMWFPARLIPPSLSPLLNHAVLAADGAAPLDFILQRWKRGLGGPCAALFPAANVCITIDGGKVTRRGTDQEHQKTRQLTRRAWHVGSQFTVVIEVGSDVRNVGSAHRGRYWEEGRAAGRELDGRQAIVFSL